MSDLLADHLSDTRRLHFKHVYGTSVNEWGVLAFPKQTSLRHYGRGDLVLLAIPKNPKLVDYVRAPGTEGTIFGVCTLLNISRPTRAIANPDMVMRHPEIADQWDIALPVLKAWRLTSPRSYQTIADGSIVRLAQQQRGRLITLPDAISDEATTWLRQVAAEPLPIALSSPARALLEAYPELAR